MPLAAISDEKSVIARKLLFLATFFFFSGGWIAALNPARHLSQYGHTAWRIQDGYFSGQARAIAQTKDGYIWIGTAGGLFRFDGVRFIPWAAPDEKELPSPDVYSLLGAADGSLWVGTRHGLFRWKDGHLTNFADATGRINAILEDRAGAVWIARTRIDPPLGPMCKVADNSLRCYGASDGLSCLYGNSLANADNGSLWIGSSEAICNWTPASSRTYLQKELAQTEGLTGVGAVVTKGDPVWAGIARAGKGLGLQQFIDGAWRDYTVPGLDGTTIAVNSLLVDRSNALWIGTVNQGIYRVLDGKAEHFRSADGLSSDAVSNIYEDVEGDIWVATSKGVDRFHDVSVASFSASEGLTTDSVSSVLASRGGTVWIGNEGALDFIEKNGLSRITPREGLPGHDITSLFEDHAGKLWLGVDNELAVYDRGQFRLIRRSNGTGVGVVARLTEDIDRNIWAYVVGKGAGLLRIRQFHIEEEFPSVQYIVSLAPDPGGGIWMGLIEGGLQRYTKGTFEDFPFPKNVGAALDLLADADGSIWVATQKNGLMRWKKGDLEFLTTKNGLPCDEIFSLIRDKAGSLWIYSKCGLLEIADSELKNWLANPRSAVKVGTYDVLDGAQPALPSFRPISSMSPDGQLWFANESVLQTIDPSHLASNLLPPPVHIEEVVADRRTHSPQETLRFPPHTRDL
ncbi:MAG: two-component regulator propeller domain-containing protein, partial [Terriglobales bacterium]